jgi:hypothetical protein
MGVLKQDTFQEAGVMGERINIYRHVVFFKFHDNTSKERVELIVEAFRTLCVELPFIRDFEWGQNSSPENLNEGYTHCFIVTFANEKDRDTYLPHPSHQAFCRNHLDENLEKVCVVDFTSNE